MRAGSMAFE